nr:25-hydroxycholesterol 7-alpha-hydroxylase [Quercus suber]
MAIFPEDLVRATPLSSHPTLLVVVILLLWVITHRLMDRSHDVASITQPEPPLALADVAYISHLYGLVSQRLSYITSLKSLSPAGICTLAFPGLPRVYIVTSLPQVLEVQKNSKRASFSAVGSRVCSKLGGVSQDNHQLLLFNPAATDVTKASFFSECRTSLRASVSSGPSYTAVLRSIEKHMQGLYTSSVQSIGAPVLLYTWLQQQVCLVSTNSIYGPHNPFQDPEIAKAFWAFNGSSIAMLAVPNALPRFITRKGFRGRERMVSAFRAYFEAGHHDLAADVVQQRQKIMLKYQVGVEDRARIETMNCIAILENTIPAVFWTLYNTITRLDLFSEIRTAADTYVKQGSSGPKIDLSTIHHEPLLFAAMHETLRCISNSQEARFVHDEDINLSSGYRLRKNSLILMPSRCIHMDGSLYPSSDPTMFDHARFLTSQSRATKALLTPTGYRGFGAGDTLCLSRHLATAEVLGILALLVTQFDFEEVSKSHKPLSMPGMTFDQLSLGFPRLNREVWVNISSRVR